MFETEDPSLQIKWIWDVLLKGYFTPKGEIISSHIHLLCGIFVFKWTWQHFFNDVYIIKAQWKNCTLFYHNFSKFI